MWDKLLYRYRKLAILTATLFVAYVIGYFWLFVPHTDFSLGWRPDDTYVVTILPPDSPAASFLQEGDTILAIDGRTVHRTATVYTTLVKPSYEYTVQRGDTIFPVNIPFPGNPTPSTFTLYAPSIILTLVFLVDGIIVFYFAHQDNFEAYRVAYTFLASAVAIIGLQGELILVSGAWVSRLIWFFAIVGAFYLGFVPHLQPLSTRRQAMFKWLLIIATISGIAAFLEAVLLFPNNSSLDRYIGIGFYELSFLLSSVSWLAVIVNLLLRIYRQPSEYEKQQIRILLFFVSLAILPVTLLTLIPRAIFDVTFIPFPVAIAFFTLVPAGFFFVIFRRGYLGLDIAFSKTVMFLALVLVTMTVFGTGFLLLNQLFQFGTDAVLPATIMLFPVLIFVAYARQPIDDWVKHLFFGSPKMTRPLPEFWSALSAKPELSTLKTIVAWLAKDLNISQTVLVFATEEGVLRPTAQINVTQWESQQQRTFEPFAKPLLRSDRRASASHPLFEQYQWIELLLPIIVRGNQNGYWAMSRPKGGYFNAEQLAYLTSVVDIIGIASEAIFLFEAAGKWSLQLLSERELQRKHLASLIHDRPLQTLTWATDNLQQVLARLNNNQAEETQKMKLHIANLKGAMDELRQICVGLFPPVLEQGLELVVEEVTDQFRERFGLNIWQEINIPDETAGSTEIATVVYKVLTEALNNVVKHAETQNVHVNLTYCDAYLTLEVADEGVGSPLLSLPLSDLARRRHVGVRSMAEFAKMVDGELSIQSNELQGTSVVLRIPLAIDQE